MEREELTECDDEELVAEMRRLAVAPEENSEYDTRQDFDVAASMLEADADEIAALKAENERIRQNSVSQEVYQMMCEERDAAVADIAHFCHLCRHRGENQDRCSACSNLKQEHDYFEWRGPQKGKE